LENVKRVGLIREYFLADVIRDILKSLKTGKNIRVGLVQDHLLCFRLGDDRHTHRTSLIERRRWRASGYVIHDRVEGENLAAGKTQAAVRVFAKSFEQFCFVHMNPDVMGLLRGCGFEH